jgi:hypothetical protein
MNYITFLLNFWNRGEVFDQDFFNILNSTKIWSMAANPLEVDCWRGLRKT